MVCENCWLVQTEDFADAHELFDESYAYFSGFSTSWLRHAEQYVEKMAARFHLGAESHVVEVAANDGYLLQYVQARGIPCTGIEPTASTAAAAREKGLAIVQEFFGEEMARNFAKERGHADLTAANNVLAHVPDINDFLSGFTVLLKPEGVSTFEFPHLLKLVELNQFDTIYHEHFSYLSLVALTRVFQANGLQIFDVKELSTHGGSLRIFAQRLGTGIQPISDRVEQMLSLERAKGLESRKFYEGFQIRTDKVKNRLLQMLLTAKAEGKKVVGYGAAAKGNTLINYAGIRPDLISFVSDRNPAKQKKYMPGSRIPIYPEQEIHMVKPDYVIILPWNLRQEVAHQLHYVRDWGGKFITAIPQLEVF